MNLLGDPLTTRPIQMRWDFTMELYRSKQFGFVDDPDRQFVNGSVWTQTRTLSDGPELSLTLFEVLADLSPAYPDLSLAYPDLLPALPGAHRCTQSSLQHSGMFPTLSQSLPVPVMRDLSYSEAQPEYPPKVWYSPEIGASKFILHILSVTPRGSQWLKYILLMMEYHQSNRFPFHPYYWYQGFQ